VGLGIIWTRTSARQPPMPNGSPIAPTVRRAKHWVCLCIVLDLYSGLVVGWSMSPRQDRQLVVHAVLMAL
jgi:transposase InsO family protein